MIGVLPSGDKICDSKNNSILKLNNLQSDLFFVLLFTSRTLHRFGCNFVYSMARFIGYGSFTVETDEFQNCLCLMLCDTQRHTPYKISLTFVSDNLMFD